MEVQARTPCEAGRRAPKALALGATARGMLGGAGQVGRHLLDLRLIHLRAQVGLRATGPPLIEDDVVAASLRFPDRPGELRRPHRRDRPAG